MKKTICNKFELFTYKEDWEEAKKVLKITDEQLRDKLEQELQLLAWGDALRWIIANAISKGK